MSVICEVCEGAPSDTTVTVTSRARDVGEFTVTGRVCRFCAGVVEHRAMVDGDRFEMVRDAS